MPIVCINDGKGFWKGITQNLSLSMMIGLFILILIICVLAIAINLTWEGDKRNFCTQNGTEVTASNTTIKFIMITIGASFILFGIRVGYLATLDKFRTGWGKYGFPSLSTICGIILIVVGIILDNGGEVVRDDATGELSQWCKQNDDATNGLSIVIYIIVGIFVLLTVYYSTYIISKVCQVY